ncbi:hypothetical protein, partial [Paracoccus marinaquae]
SPGFEAIPPLAASNPGEEIIDKNAEADRLKAGGLYPIHGKSSKSQAVSLLYNHEKQRRCRASANGPMRPMPGCRVGRFRRRARAAG